MSATGEHHLKLRVFALTLDDVENFTTNGKHAAWITGDYFVSDLNGIHLLDKTDADLVGPISRITQLLIGDGLGETLDTEDDRAQLGVMRHADTGFTIFFDEERNLPVSWLRNPVSWLRNHV